MSRLFMETISAITREGFKTTSACFHHPASPPATVRHCVSIVVHNCSNCTDWTGTRLCGRCCEMNEQCIHYVHYCNCSFVDFLVPSLSTSGWIGSWADSGGKGCLKFVVPWMLVSMAGKGLGAVMNGKCILFGLNSLNLCFGLLDTLFTLG